MALGLGRPWPNGRQGSNCFISMEFFVKKTTQWLGGAFLVACLIYALSPNLGTLSAKLGFWEWRNHLVFFSGVVSLAFMALAMLISVRPSWAERAMGGLDKAYVLHKWAGIWAWVAVLVHWLLEHLPRAMVKKGLLLPPGPSAKLSLSPLAEKLVRSGLHFADFIFFLMLALMLVALLRKIPYRFFGYAHKLFPVVFLVAAWHSVTVQLKAQWLSSPAGYLVIALALAGSIPAFISLFQGIAKTRKVKAVVAGLQKHGGNMLDIRLETPPQSFAHSAGQFAFLSFEHDKEPHPFTIASAGGSPSLRFVIKALGDHTFGLMHRLNIGERVEVEGPYGQFHFRDNKARQIWVAGGIGITPFMARLDELEKAGPYASPRPPIDFWYCTQTEEENRFPENLEALCQKSGIRLYRKVAQKGELLSAEEVGRAAGGLQEAGVWFCGPKAFAQSLREGLKRQGLEGEAFHCEAFEMR